MYGKIHFVTSNSINVCFLMTPEADINMHTVSLTTNEAIQYNLTIVPILPFVLHASALGSEPDGIYWVQNQFRNSGTMRSRQITRYSYFLNELN